MIRSRGAAVEIINGPDTFCCSNTFLTTGITMVIHVVQEYRNMTI
jgi:hypothetical protein